MIYPIEGLDAETVEKSRTPQTSEIGDEIQVGDDEDDIEIGDEIQAGDDEDDIEIGSDLSLTETPTFQTKSIVSPQESETLSQSGGTETSESSAASEESEPRERTATRTEYEFEIKELVGKIGLSRTMYFNERKKMDFEYKEKTLTNFGRIFSPEELPKYSGKI